MTALTAFHRSLNLVEIQRNQDCVKVGGNAFLSAPLQIWQAIFSLGFVRLALDAAGCQPIHWTARWAIYLSPVVLAVIQESSVVPDGLRPALAAISIRGRRWSLLWLSCTLARCPLPLRLSLSSPSDCSIETAYFPPPSEAQSILRCFLL